MILLINKPQVFVQNEKGVIGTYDVDVNETVDQLQTKIYNKERVPQDQQKLLYDGQTTGVWPRSCKTTTSCQETPFYLSLRLRGGQPRPGFIMIQFINKEKMKYAQIENKY